MIHQNDEPEIIADFRRCYQGCLPDQIGAKILAHIQELTTRLSTAQAEIERLRRALKEVVACDDVEAETIHTLRNTRPSGILWAKRYCADIARTTLAANRRGRE